MKIYFSIIRIVSVLLGLLSITSRTYGLSGNTTGQEIGDALYYDLTEGGWWASRLISLGGEDLNHAALYAGVDVNGSTFIYEVANDNDAAQTHWRSIVQAGATYHGAYTSSINDLDFYQRQNILLTAQSLCDLELPATSPTYDAFVPISAVDPATWTGDVNQVSEVRCDGLVELAYEANGFKAWYASDKPTMWDITATGALTPGIFGITLGPPHTVWINESKWALELPRQGWDKKATPKGQRDGWGYGNTGLGKPAVVDKPTIPSVTYNDTSRKATVLARDLKSGIGQISVVQNGVASSSSRKDWAQLPSGDREESFDIGASTTSFMISAVDTAGNTSDSITKHIYTLTTSVTGNGTISKSPNFAKYLEGADFTVTASAGANYAFSNWTINGVVVGTDASFNSSLFSNTTLVANFVPSQTNHLITLTASPSAGGSVTGNGTYAGGSSRTVTAHAYIGYTFTNWTESGTVVSTNASYSFTLNGNRTLVANFSGSVPVDADQYEPNDRSIYATSIQPNTPISARISSATDADWYRFTTAGSGQISVNLTVPAGTDYDLELYAPDGTWVAGSYKDVGVAELINFSALVAGTYSIRVYGYNGSFSTTQTYGLSYSFGGGVLTPAFSYTDEGSTITITGFETWPVVGAVVIPSTIDGKPVTRIDDFAFGHYGLTSVTIPSSVTSISPYAFSNCYLLDSIAVAGDNPMFSSQDGILFDKSFHVLIQYPCAKLGDSYTIPSSVTTIEAAAFWDNNILTSLILPVSVTTILGEALRNCSKLTSISVISGNLSFCTVDGVLFDKSQQVLIQYPCAKSGASYTIPSSVTSISYEAFWGNNNLKTVAIPASVTQIFNYAFWYCSNLTSINVAGDNPAFASLDGVLFDKNLQSLIQYPSAKAGTGYVIPSSVTSIGFAAFLRCTGLTSVTIPTSVRAIGYEAFWGCTELTSAVIPAGVTSIGGNAFSDCYRLTSVSIPSGVASIGAAAFSNCRGLTNATISSGVTNIGYAAFSGCSGLTSIVIPFSVITIGDHAFYDCSGLTSLTISPGVANIGAYAFAWCSGLTGTTIPNSVTTIGRNAFQSCSGLRSVNIPTSVSSLGMSAFWGCSGMTSVTIPDSLTSIESFTFGGCRSLTGVVIPASVINIGNNAFESCCLLASAEFLGNAPSMSDSVFADAASGFTVKYHSGKSGFSSPTWMGYPSVNVDVAPTRTISLSGTLEFGNVTAGSSATARMTINNSGTSAMTVSGISYPSGFRGNWSGGTISASSSRTVTVTFSPTSASNYGGTVTVTSDKTSGTNTISCSGSGTVAPARIISLSGNLTFGSVAVNSTATSTLTISNSGNWPLTVSSITYPSGFSGNWSSGTIAAGSSQSVTVTFAPTVVQTYSGTLTVNSDSTLGTGTAAVDGLGVAQPTPYATWEGSRFTAGDIATGLTTLTADFDRDGMANLLEYAFGKNPKAADATGIAPNVSGNKMEISFPCDANRTDITYTVQASSTLAANSWIDIAESIGGAATVPIESRSTVSDCGIGLRTVTVTEAATFTGKRFLRVKVSSP